MLSLRYLFTSESLDRTHPHRNRHAQPFVNRSRENSHSEKQLRNTSHNLFLTPSLSPHQTASVCLTHAHKHKPELSDKVYPVIPLRRLLSCSLCFLGRAILAQCSHQLLCRKKHASSIRSEPESKERRTNSSNF